jgi:hypothetical protein
MRCHPAVKNAIGIVKGDPNHPDADIESVKIRRSVKQK